MTYIIRIYYQNDDPIIITHTDLSLNNSTHSLEHLLHTIKSDNQVERICWLYEAGTEEKWER